MMMTKHVEDLKVDGVPPRLQKVLGQIGKVLFPMGINQTRHRNGDVEWDQASFISDLIPIEHPKVMGAKGKVVSMMNLLRTSGVCWGHLHTP